MTPRLAHVFRHPIKAHGREALASVVLSQGRALPFDRVWAVAHGRSKFDPDAPAWTPCGHFQRGARTPAVMAITAAYDEARAILRLSHPQLEDLTFDPAHEAERLLAWLAPISPEGEMAPRALVQVPGVAMTDSDFPSVSINNLASNAALAAEMGMGLDLGRWRGNLWLEGLAPWAEEAWLGKRLRIGDSLLEIRAPIGRCKATMADPVTGEIAGDTLGALRKLRGQQNFGVYGYVLEGGRIALGDRAEVIE